MIRFLMMCVAVLVPAVSASAQSTREDSVLSRRGWFGVALGPHENGVLVTGLAAGSPAAEAGIRAGDVIRTIDNAAVRKPEDVTATIGRHVGGETAVVAYVRAGEAREVPVVLRPFPRETLPGATVEYGSVTLSDGSRLRTIVSIPNGGGAFPAVMLLQGGGCNSVDVPMVADADRRDPLMMIATRGFVTMRVEKSGLGDSKGPPCAEIGYLQELEGYRAALAALKRHPSVKADETYLLGISLGGVFAPIVASESAVHGIAVFAALPWPPSPYPGRSDRFFREIARIDLDKAWSAVSARVLILYGEFDETMTGIDRTRIARAVNDRRPGAATQVEFPGLDHCWTRHESMEQSRGRCGQGRNEASLVADTVLRFLQNAR